MRPDEAAFVARWRAEVVSQSRGRRSPSLAAAVCLAAAASAAAGRVWLAAACVALLLVGRQLASCVWWPLDALLGAVLRRHIRTSCQKAAQRHRAEPQPEAERCSADALSGWHLKCDGGRQRWTHGAGTPQTASELRHLGLAKQPAQVAEALPLARAVAAGAESLCRQQEEETGHWAHDYGGPLFLLPGCVFAEYIIHRGDVGKMLTDAHRFQMRRYLRSVQRSDGGWGLHVEGTPTTFGTALNYVALMLLGEPRDSAAAVAARGWLQRNGGAVAIPSWGKFWLCLLGLYDWRGLRPVSPELWLLPQSCPLFPGNLWCHTRMVYLPMGYLYGRRWSTPADDLLMQLRADLFPPPLDFATVDWERAAYTTAEHDVVTPVHWLADVAFRVLYWYEHRVGAVRTLRRWALDECDRHMLYDDCSTNFICLGPVNKVLNMVACFAKEGWGERLQLHEDRLHDYLWLGTDGMKMQGYNGSQLWDAAFACQALHASGMADRHRDSVRRALRFVASCQVLESPPDAARYCRQDSRGAWNFSTAEQGWQVTDCTAEGLRCFLLLSGGDLPKLEESRVFAAVDQILRLRNPDDGAWCSYEPRRAPVWMELLNPSDCFSRIMVEYTYTECTSACVQTLVAFRNRYPGHRSADVSGAIEAGAERLLQMQRADGSWVGSWGMCFTYAIFFGVEALAAWGGVGAKVAIAKACRFLLDRQREDGGWSEDFSACLRGQWVEGEDSQVVHTAWALMALVAGGADRAAAARAATFLRRRQNEDGSWPQERELGVFNGSCGIHYASYRHVFPLWALGMFQAAEGPAAQDTAVMP